MTFDCIHMSCDVCRSGSTSIYGVYTYLSVHDLSLQRDHESQPECGERDNLVHFE